MKQGTTFVLVVDLQLDMSYVKSIIFTLKNKGKILTKEDWRLDNGKFKIPFTQEETVLLEGRTLIEAQINFEDGNVAKSEIKEIFIKESLATQIVDGNKATKELEEIELEVDGDVVYTDGVGGGDFKLQVATENQLGGVKPLNKTDDMTLEVGVNKDGRLFAKGKGITVDNELSEESTNPVQNKVVANEVNSLKQKDESLDKEVIALRERNAELEETVEKLQIKTTTEPSPFHHITDSANMKVLDFGMEGKTEQRITSGNQLFDISKFVSDSPCVNNGDGTITLTCYAPLVFSSIKQVCPNVKVGQTIIFSGKNAVRVYFGSVVKNANTAFEVTQGMLDNDKFAFYGKSDTTSDNPLTISDIMINEGTTAKPYEPYTGGVPSPNPDYPQEITLAGVYNEATGRYEHKCRVCNKNSFDKEHASDESNWGSDKQYRYYPIYVGKGNTVTVSIDKALETGLGFYVAIDFREIGIGMPTLYWLYHSDNATLCKQSVTFTASEGDYIWVNCNGVEKMKQYMFDTLQVEISSEQTPYAESIPSFTLTSDRPLTMWDKLVKRDGKWYWDYKQLKLSLTGEDNWRSHATYNFIINALPETMTRRVGFCNQFKVQTRGTLSANEIWLGSANTTIFAMASSFYDESLEDKGLANWKAHLNEHPLEIYTYKDESELVPLLDEEQTLLNNLETYYGVTNVYNEQGCPMWLTYVNDTKLYVDNQLLEIKKAMI